MDLRLGPLRHVGERTAVIWLQADHAAEVEVLGASARTFEVDGCHFG